MNRSNSGGDPPEQPPAASSAEPEIGLWDPLGAWPQARPLLWSFLAIIAGSAMVPHYLDQLSRRDNSITDFFQEWASARNFLEGLPVYTNHRVTIPRYLGKMNPGAGDLFVEINAHPPTSVLITIPFGALSYCNALLVWNILSLCALFTSLWLVWRGLGIPFRRWSPLPTMTLLLLCFPLLMHIHFGQTTLLILLLLTGTWAADRVGRRMIAGALLGTAVTVKLFPAVVFLFFAFNRNWKTIASGSVSIGLITLATRLVLGSECYVTYASTVVPRVAKYQGLWFNLSLPGYWAKLFNPSAEYPFVQPLSICPALARSATILSCLIIFVVLARAATRAKTRAELDLSFGLTLTAMLLISPITWDHYLLLLLLPLTMAWIHLPRSQGPRVLLVAIVVAFWTWPYFVFDLTIPGGIVNGTAYPIHTLTVGSYQCYALLALFALEIVELRRLVMARARSLPAQVDTVAL